MSLFEKGREKTGGRASGTRNKFSKKFDDALLKDFEEHGEAAIKIARIERPTVCITARTARLLKRAMT